eukprot:3147427-Rhodomonas_salina.2
MVDSELQSFDPIQLVEGCRDLGLHFRVTSQVPSCSSPSLCSTELLRFCYTECGTERAYAATRRAVLSYHTVLS